MTQPAPLISTNQLSYRIGKFELGPLSLSVPEGSITALIGPNGAGKSTLLDLLFGLGKVQEGEMSLAGLQQPRDDVAIKERVGFVSPDMQYAGWGRIGSALDYLSGFYPAWDATECERLLELFALDRKTKITGLSFGQRTRLALVIALARETDVLLLDEPTTGLDVVGRRHLFAELMRYIEVPGRAILISSHQLSDLERLTDRVAIIHDGSLVAEGAMDELVERYEQWDIEIADGLPVLPEGMALIAQSPERVRVMADLKNLDGEPSLQGKIIAKVPMSLEEVYLGLTGELS